MKTINVNGNSFNMKYKILVLLSLSVLFITGCGNKNKNDIKQNILSCTSLDRMCHIKINESGEQVEDYCDEPQGILEMNYYYNEDGTGLYKIHGIRTLNADNSTSTNYQYYKEKCEQGISCSVEMKNALVVINFEVPIKKANIPNIPYKQLKQHLENEQLFHQYFETKCEWK